MPYYVTDAASGAQVLAKIRPATEIREHYIQDYGAEPFRQANPYLLLLEGDAAKRLFSQYLKEE